MHSEKKILIIINPSLSYWNQDSEQSLEGKAWMMGRQKDVRPKFSIWVLCMICDLSPSPHFPHAWCCISASGTPGYQIGYMNGLSSLITERQRGGGAGRWVVQMLRGELSVGGGLLGFVFICCTGQALVSSSELHNHMLLRWLTALTLLQLLLYLSVSLSLSASLPSILRSAQLLCLSPSGRELFGVAAWCYFGPHRFRRRERTASAADVR